MHFSEIKKHKKSRKKSRKYFYGPMYGWFGNSEGGSSDASVDESNGNTMKLGDLCEIRINFPDADFWLIRKHNIDVVGKPVREFDAERIGIKVIKTDVLDSRFLYYLMQHIFNSGYWKPRAHGLTRLVNIKTNDVKNIQLGGRSDESINSIKEVSDKEREQMGTKKGRYNYISPDEYEKLRPYLVQRSINRAAKSKIDNKPVELDPTMTAYTPGETLQLLDHPKVKQWFKRIEKFKIPDKYGLVVLVGCAATKPWGFSCVKGDFYPYYNQIRKDVQSGKMKPVYFVTISEPLGIVPEDLWGDDPMDYFPQYDNPGLFKDTPQQSGMMTKDWSKSPIGSKREMPFDDESFKEAINRLGQVIGTFIKNNSQHEFVSFLEHPSKTRSTHSLMLDVAETVSGKQIPRNPKKPMIGRKQDIGQYMRGKINDLMSPKNNSEENVSEMMSSVYKMNIPQKYKQLPILGRGKTSIVLDAGPEKVIMITRDSVKTEWLMQDWGLGIAKFVEKIDYSYHPKNLELSKLPLYVLELPKLFKLSPENRKIIKIALKELDRIFSVETNLEKSEARKSMKMLAIYMERHQNGLFKDLIDFLHNYDMSQYKLDLHMGNFVQDADGKIIIIDPIIDRELWNILIGARRNNFYENN